MLEAHKDRHFVAPGIAILYAMLNEAEAYGVSRAKATAMGYQIEWDAALESLAKMHKRGIRVLPGGDYGFAMTPHCQNARDLEFFVKYLGMTPMEAIVSATRYGGEIMMQGHELGEIKEGYLADLLLIDGDPLSNLSVLREPSRMLAVMKDGVFYKDAGDPFGAHALEHDGRMRTNARRFERRMIAQCAHMDLVGRHRRPDRSCSRSGRSPTNERLFFVTLLNGLTLGSLYFIVASGFTLVFGLMRNVNLAHGSLYLLGGYVGFIVAERTGWWLLAVAAGFAAAAVVGLLMQLLIFRRMPGRGPAPDDGDDRPVDRHRRHPAVDLHRPGAPDGAAGVARRQPFRGLPLRQRLLVVPAAAACRSAS